VKLIKYVEIASLNGSNLRYNNPLLLRGRRERNFLSLPSRSSGFILENTSDVGPLRISEFNNVPSESSLIAHARHWNGAISNYEEIFLSVTFPNSHVLIFTSIWVNLFRCANPLFPGLLFAAAIHNDTVMKVHFLPLHAISKFAIHNSASEDINVPVFECLNAILV